MTNSTFYCTVNNSYRISLKNVNAEMFQEFQLSP